MLNSATVPSGLPSEEAECLRVLRDMADGRIPIRWLNLCPSHARKSVVGEPTAVTNYHGHERKCVVRVFVEVVIVEDADEDLLIPGHRDV